MATPAQNSPYPRNWNAPYRAWTATDLLISNGLRATPHPYADLALFASHSPGTLRVLATRLRQQGRLQPGTLFTLPDHPDNQLLAGTPRALPLPELGSRPALASTTSAQHEARTLANRVLSDSTSIRGHTRFDRPAARAILEEWITSGAAGKDTPTFMRAWLDLTGGDTAGPPPPTSPASIHSRLLTLLRALGSAARPALQTFLAELEAPPADPTLPGEAPALPPLDDPHQLSLPTLL